MDSDSDLLLSLYREARELPTAEFQDFAIRLIRPVLRFESAIWGAGYFSGPTGASSLVPVRSATHDIDPAGFAYWKSINRADKIIPLVRAAPWTTFNFHAPSMFAAVGDGVMRDYARRFGRQSYLVTALATIDTPVFEWCSLYRPDPNDQFSDVERARCQMLVKHLSEALKVNDLVQDVGRGFGRSAVDEFAALVDREGRIVSVQQGFLTLCRQQWREFDERRVAAAVMRQLTGPGDACYRGRCVTLSARRLSDYVWLTARVPTRPGELSPRRMDVASLFARGHSAKEIARLLGVSSSTVRNQIAASYRVLGVSSRFELQAALRQNSSPRGTA